jgi:beta-glucosidase
MRKHVLTIVGLLASTALWAQLPYQNPSLSSEQRAQDLISRLTIQEKATLMCDVSDAVPRLGIKKFNWWSEALHGLANNDSVTVFPEPIGMAASFNDDLLFRIYDATSDETRAKYNDWIKSGKENKRFLSLSVWTPNINIFRDPRWGRGQETYGEDPYLTSRMGVSVVKGLQGPADSKYKKLLACAKHFAVHSGPEWSRHTLNLNEIDPRDLWETYLPAFKALVQDADVRQVMCAYQRLNDEPCCGNSTLLQRILREQWGYKYMVVSDCDAITDFHTGHHFTPNSMTSAAKGTLAGTDVECAWDKYNYTNLPEAIKKGLITEKEIDKHLLRVLVARFDLGEMDKDALVPWSNIPISVINNEEHRRLALDMARQTMTLLQNKNSVLPLDKNGKIAVIGPNANDREMLWGNYNGVPIRTISILEGIRSKVASDRLKYDKGCELFDEKQTLSYLKYCSINGKKGFSVTYWNNSNRKGKPVSVQQLEKPLEQNVNGTNVFAPGVMQAGFSAKYETILEAPESGEIMFKFSVIGDFEIRINGKVFKKTNAWRIVPNRLPFVVEKGKKYRIELLYAQTNNWKATVQLDFGKQENTSFDALIQALRGYETVVFVGGLSPMLEGEEMPVELPGFKGGDRTDIELPAIQRNCLQALKKAGKKVVFVNCSGSAVGLVPETESCDAILQAWYAGESGGQAVADVLFGDYNPSGKLPVTFYKSVKQLPDFEDYSMKGRTYRFMDDALFPFGFGLSYTEFTIGTAIFDKTDLLSDESTEMALPITNIGKRTGTEVVQVYIHRVGDTDGPLKTLRKFERITLTPGDSKTILIRLNPEDFAFYDTMEGKMVVKPGVYEVFYGNSSKNLLKTRVTIQQPS